MKKLYRLHPMQELRDHNYLLLQLSHEITKLHPDIEIIEDTADKMNITVGEYSVDMYECELLIDYGTHLSFITFTDYTSQLMGLFVHRQNPLDVFVYGQPKNKYHGSSFKLKQGIYVSRWPYINLDTYYNMRKLKTTFIDKMVFRGNYGSLPRNTVYTLLEPRFEPYFAGASTMNPHEYFIDVTNYKIGLSIPGAGEFCYRDVEYMAMGVPMLRFEYESNLTPPLIPNYHYISIPRPEGMDYETERSGKPEYADMYLQRFLEVRNDEDFLKFIANNARQYYETWLSNTNRIKHTLNLMEITNG